VIGGEGGGEDRSHPEHTVLCPGLFEDFAKAHQGNLRRINHAIDRLDSQVAQVSHGNGGIGHLRAAEPPGPHPGDEVAQHCHQFVQALQVRVVDSRCHQTTLT
jgi:hypothetical protein